MDSEESRHRRNRSTPQAIPLQDFNVRDDTREEQDSPGSGPGHRRTLSDRGRSMFRHARESVAWRYPHTTPYAPIEEDAPSRSVLRNQGLGLGLNTDLVQQQGRLSPAPGDGSGFSPVGPGLQEAMGFAGLSWGGATSPQTGSTSSPRLRAMRRNLPTLRTVAPEDDETRSLVDDEEFGDGTGAFPSENDNDTIPLTDAGRLTAANAGDHGHHYGRKVARNNKSFGSLRFLSPSLGHNGFPDPEAGSLTPESAHTTRIRSNSNRSLSPSSPIESPFRRAGTVMRKMSQRVVNISNEADVVERSIRRTSSLHDSHAHHSSRSPSRSPSPSPHRIQVSDFASNVDGAQPYKGSEEKNSSPVQERALPPRPLGGVGTNPLRGKSLGIFPPDSPIRLKLLEFLTHPFLEPAILVLIVFQTIILAINASTPLYQGDSREQWGASWTDWALLALFVIYTIEIIVHVIVSGFMVNPVEYSTINRQIGIKKAITIKANNLFALHRKPSIHRGGDFSHQQPSLIRTFTGQVLQDFEDTPGDSRQAQRRRLAHRAFLRHSFNRLDFVAVVSFWISFWIDFFGVESTEHVYVFRMLSCLRILRLLGITGGTSVILQSLKRAMPILLHVAFLIGFFWLLFAIVGIQSFKSSLRRTCVWQDPEGIQSSYIMNQTGNFQFCGGWIAPDGTPQPYVLGDMTTPGASEPKGYWCPINSTCVEGQNPYNGTVSFDNLVQSLELVFVVMTSNTFTDLMYYLMDTDYVAAALFFAFGIVILTFWMVNLLIAVITSSFAIIRDESKHSAFAAEEPTDEGAHNDEEAEEEEQAAQTLRESSMQRAFDKTRYLWIAIIVFGLVAQALRSATMSDGRANFIITAERMVTLALDIEILFRFLVNWRGFFYNKRNIVDLSLAIITSIIQLPPIVNSGQPYAWLTIFQILRIYRVVLALPVTRNLITIVLRNFYGLLNLILFVFLLTFLAAIFASQLFRGQLPYQDNAGNTLQVSFSWIWNAFIGMYQLLSSENWTTVLYSVTGEQVQWNNGWIGAAFCIIWFILANFIVLNMFIAVIQESFDVSEDEKRLQQVKAFLQKKRFHDSSAGQLSLSTIFKFGRVGRQDPLDFGTAATEMLLKDAVVKDFLDDPEDTPQPPTPPSAQPSSTSTTPKPAQRFLIKVKGFFFDPEPNPFYSRLQLSNADQELDPRQMAKEVVIATERRKIAQREYLKKHPKYNKSLYIFEPNNAIRRFCQTIVGPGRGERIEGKAPSIPIWYSFSAFVYMAIVAMVLLACITTPVYQRDYFQTHKYLRANWFVLSDIGFAVLFTVEAIIKVIADGFFFTPNAYFRSSWGFIDGVVLLTLWINVIALLYNPGGGSRAIGAFKALRALRLLNVSDSARDTFHSVIIMGGSKVLSAAFVSLSLLIPFALYGLNLFAGQMYNCNDQNSGIYNLTDCTGEYLSSPYEWNVLAPRQVANSYYSFDDFGSSLFILFQIVSQEGWIDVLNTATSITGIFTQQNYFNQQGNAVFFIVFNLLGAVFVLTLFVSVFMRNYTEQTGVAFLTTDQRSWLELRKLLRQVAPSKRPSSKKQRENWQEWCYKRAIKKNGRWQRFITILLVLHLVLLCLEWYPDRSHWLRVRDFIFLCMMFVYIANITIRVIGLSWPRFRKSAWDMYAVFAVSGTFVTTVLLLTNFRQRDYVQAHKLFLVSVALLLIPRNNQLDQLFKTAAASLTAIGNLLATWFVLFLVFAIAMTQTFGLTRFGANETGNLNFRSVPKALILLFRMSVGEGWNQIMNDFASVQPPYCNIGESYYDGDCGSANWARALFIAWNIMSMYIFVNLFVSLIYESFSYVYQRSSGLSVISREEIRRFKQAWAEFDPDGTGYISKTAFPRLLGVSADQSLSFSEILMLCRNCQVFSK